MPKGGKRKGGTPNSEIIEAAQRMIKHPEHLEAAQNSRTWLNFLDNIGIDVNIGEGGRKDFFEKVREEFKPEGIITRETGHTIEQLAKALVNPKIYVYRGAGGKFTKTPNDKPIVTLVDAETKRYIGKKDVEKRVENT